MSEILINVDELSDMTDVKKMMEESKKELENTKKVKLVETLFGSLLPFRDAHNPWATYVQIKRPGKAPLCVETDSQDLVLHLRNESRLLGSPSDVVRRVIDDAAAQARFGPEERTVAIRTAQKDGSWYFNLGNGAVVRIDATGWKLANEAPVQFVQTKYMQPLPTPDAEGTLNDLRPFVRLRDQEWPLFVAWLLMSFTPVGPFPVAAVIGEHGSGKSVLEQISSRLIDPSNESVRSLPGTDQELQKVASRRWLMTFDNLSAITRTMSDALCRTSTGTGTVGGGTEDTSTRRPVMITSIEDLSLENDLLDRTLWLAMPPLRDGERIAEIRLWPEFMAAYPRILGGIFNALVEVRKQLTEVPDTDLPRMADYARLGVAAEGVLGLQPGEFLLRYGRNREAIAEMLVESSPLGSLIRWFVLANRKWSGTAQELIVMLQGNVWAAEAKKAAKDLSSPRRLSGALRKLAPSLRRLDIDISFERSAEKREMKLELTRDRTDQEEGELAVLAAQASGEQVTKPEDNIHNALGKLAKAQKKGVDAGRPDDGSDGHDGPIEAVATPAAAAQAA